MDAVIEVDLQKPPTYCQVIFQDDPVRGTTSAPFRLENLSQILAAAADKAGADWDGTIRETDTETPNLSPKPGYSITVIWWMPRKTKLRIPFVISHVAGGSSANVADQVVYLGESGLGIVPSAAHSTLVPVTCVVNTAVYK